MDFVAGYDSHPCRAWRSARSPRRGRFVERAGRPENLFAYGDPDLAALAAAYAFLARNHPFADGNKRTSFVVCLTFLALNGAELPIDDDNNIDTWLALANGSLEETALPDWLRARMVKIG